jgi:SAM-dependent methyltransferase
MLNTLGQRWTLRTPSVRLLCIKADLQDVLPPAARPINVIFTIATFHILKRWQEALKNLADALCPDGYFIFVRENNQFMHQTEGFEKDSDFPYLDQDLSAFMRFYHAQRSSVGEPYQAKTLRYSDMMPAIEHLRALGFVEEASTISESDFSWQKPHTFSDILHCFRHRQMTTWGSDLSDRARERIAESLEQWVAKKGLDAAKEFMLPARLIPHILRKQR